MTVARDVRRPHTFHAPATLVSVLGLALGDEDAAPRSSAEWWDVYRLASRERCAALIWLRSGNRVRREAPEKLTREWRLAVVHQYRRGAALLTRVGRSTSRLIHAGIPCVVLKGAPLAAHLYGDPLIRPMDDVDLQVARHDWRRAAEVLRQDGWSKEQGTAEWSEIYRLAEDSETYRLDMQSSILVDHLDHLPRISGTVADWRWNGVVFPAHVGPEVAVFLAVHLLKHQLPPLLWLVDFHTYWTGMAEKEQGEAMRIATSGRAQRYLEWAVTRSSLLVGASRGCDEAMRTLGFHPSFRRDDYGMIRLAGLAATLPDMVSVLAAWAWPRPLRYDWSAFRRMWGRRATKSLTAAFAARRSYLDPRHESPQLPRRVVSSHAASPSLQ